MQLHWVFGEFFVTPSLWRNIFAPLEVASREATSKDGSRLQSVVQLVVSNEVDVETAGLVSETCDSCGREKFSPPTRGFFPRVLASPSLAVARTKPWFGSGGSAYRPVLLTQRVRKEMLIAKARGVSFVPCG